MKKFFVGRLTVCIDLDIESHWNDNGEGVMEKSGDLDNRSSVKVRARAPQCHMNVVNSPTIPSIMSVYDAFSFLSFGPLRPMLFFSWLLSGRIA